jgi:hypothetical protein
MWKPVVAGETIPTSRNLMVAVEDGGGMHALEFPCRYVDGVWVDAKTGRLVDVRPTHWRDWPKV